MRRIPKNIISENLYTQGNEFVDAKTNASYQGYYCELNGKFYIGKSFDANASEIVKVKQSNSLFNNISTVVFSAISGITSQSISPSIIKGNPVGGNNLEYNNEKITFYSKQLNVNPILIRSINESTYLSIQKDAIYQTTYIGDYKGNLITANQAYAQMPGLKEFLEG